MVALTEGGRSNGVVSRAIRRSPLACAAFRPSNRCTGYTIVARGCRGIPPVRDVAAIRSISAPNSSCCWWCAPWARTNATIRSSMPSTNRPGKSLPEAVPMHYSASPEAGLLGGSPLNALSPVRSAELKPGRAANHACPRLGLATDWHGSVTKVGLDLRHVGLSEQKRDRLRRAQGTAQ